MTARARGGDSAALNTISGEVSTDASWHEDIVLEEDGEQATEVEDWEWRMTFRKGHSDSADLTINEGSAETVLEIRVAASALTSMDGDYVADIASKDTDGRIIHWAHGIVTFNNDPIAW
jgi:hypothetical protein